MTRNWYAVYTRPQKEKKVSYLLNKKGLESFCPVTLAPGNEAGSKRQLEKALFSNVVFVHITEAEIKSLITTPSVVSIAYWKSKPAIISDNEIDIVKRVVDTYTNIRLEKASVEMGGSAKIFDTPTVEYNEKTISIKQKSVKVTLPSLGFTIIAERVKQKSDIIYPQGGLFTSFPKRINAFFFN